LPKGRYRRDGLGFSNSALRTATLKFLIEFFSSDGAKLNS